MSFPIQLKGSSSLPCSTRAPQFNPLRIGLVERTTPLNLGHWMINLIRIGHVECAITFQPRSNQRPIFWIFLTFSLLLLFSLVLIFLGYYRYRGSNSQYLLFINSFIQLLLSYYGLWSGLWQVACQYKVKSIFFKSLVCHIPWWMFHTFWFHISFIVVYYILWRHVIHFQWIYLLEVEYLRHLDCLMVA